MNPTPQPAKKLHKPTCAIYSPTLGAKCDCITWETRLDELALTEPDPNTARYNLPELKGFIYLLLKEESARTNVKLSEDAKVVWQYVAQELDLIEKSMKPLREAIKFLRETNQI